VEEGGLGIKDVGKFNITLVAKWKLRLGIRETGVWKDILESRYGDWREMPRTMVERKSSYWWKDLCKICDVDKPHNWFDGKIKWKHGNGRTIKFWEDNGSG